MLEKLRTANVDRFDLDELVELSAFARQIRGEYDALSLDQPEWITDASKRISVELKSRMHDNLVRRQKQIKSKLDELKTPTERKDALRKELQAVEKALAS